MLESIRALREIERLIGYIEMTAKILHIASVALSVRRGFKTVSIQV